MSRIKKSRKPGVASSGVVKAEKQHSIAIKQKKPKKQTGNKPGNRQQEAKVKKDNSKTKATKIDPRLGSKKPIALTPSQTKAPEQGKQQKSSSNKHPAFLQKPVHNSQPVDDKLALRQELDAIEEDILLQNILAKQESHEELSESDVDYYNQKMSRYEELQDALGLSDESESEMEQSSDPNIDDDDALWEKLENNRFSSFD